jgi:hypothetical protein
MGLDKEYLPTLWSSKPILKKYSHGLYQFEKLLSSDLFLDQILCFHKYFIRRKCFAIKPRDIEIAPPARNRKPIILNPSASSLIDMKLLPIKIQTIPKARIIMPAIKKGLNSIADSLLDLVIGPTLVI